MWSALALHPGHPGAPVRRPPRSAHHCQGWTWPASETSFNQRNGPFLPKHISVPIWEEVHENLSQKKKPLPSREYFFHMELIHHVNSPFVRRCQLAIRTPQCAITHMVSSTDFLRRQVPDLFSSCCAQMSIKLFYLALSRLGLGVSIC